MTTNRPYTSWGNWSKVSAYSTSPDADITDYLSGGDSDWCELMEKSGAYDLICKAYRDAINEALPAGVSLAGDEFLGPYEIEEGEFDGYPTTEDGDVDLKACLEGIDLGQICDRFDVLTLDDIAREMGSKAKEPAKAASRAMQRGKVEPLARVQLDGWAQPRAVYLAEQVRAALKSRPGAGARTDRASV
ncbi:hypothetical protein [Streptomyces sampsonii]|uniref:hypothetical protein n=1 Tax=Streptomyces sampsonii TaxID=42239 RepID=UPI0008F47400|nr:hypothetical protein [Streptomyces sampsonii]